MVYLIIFTHQFGISQFNLKNVIRHMSMNDNIASLDRNFKWITGPPILRAGSSKDQQRLSAKDPTLVSYQDNWHLFYTVRGKSRSHAIAYRSSGTLNRIGEEKEVILTCHDGFFCAPQVFYFRPHGQWYLICQAANNLWSPPYQPAFSISTDISSPDVWTELKPLGGSKPENAQAWLDFWVICDQTNAYLFFTSLDGKMWRASTPLADFPQGWSQPVIALEADIFEASHIYRLKGQNIYLTLIEAQHGHGWRYYKAYVADQLNGSWHPLAAEKDCSFATMQNVTQTDARWTDSISHGELIRAGYDELLEVDADNPRFIFQGVTDAERKGKNYGEIPWRLGLLKTIG